MSCKKVLYLIQWRNLSEEKKTAYDEKANRMNEATAAEHAAKMATEASSDGNFAVRLIYEF